MSVILMPVKSSLTAAKEIQRVGDLARGQDAVVVVLHIHETVNGHLAVDYESDDHCIADIVAHTLIMNGIPARTEIVVAPVGTLADVIAKVADDCCADVVVIGDTSASWTSDQGLSDRVGQRLAGGMRLVTVR